MGKRRRSLEEILSTTCAACNRPFDTVQGLSAHQTTSQGCAWYKKGKLKEVFAFDISDDEDDIGLHELDAQSQREREPQGEDPSDLASLYDFVDVRVPGREGTSSKSGTSSAQSRRTLDDNADPRVEDVDEDAARVIRTDEAVRKSWREQRRKEAHRHDDREKTVEQGDRDPSNPWEPFESEMDWRFASWAIQEGLSRGSVDRALAIPGFKERLGLSYHNSYSLLQRVDSLPERAEWRERWLTFKDRPNEEHLVQYRDIIEAIRTLLGNPEHADRIVYRPRRIFSDASRTNRIYNEMWSGRWWHAVQVSRVQLSTP
ncbi:uncharacterized protein B0H18DRAFT_888958 [Fomitopsis serialis]|uniref:uncharacterized protein n=1 Tax=Fomitopsis serialis TaxID=139415 RepID=UPI002008C7A1|nr:uncharacterized protein B0H18DRAFT_888958 [Neoantrodia serialis]KAH9913048.1 hypothetical protein B0H18DRAFT_888958 [Neoantrodia serialis]